jgi:hypothetical protein
MACGSKKGPTGGDPDLIKPKVLSTSPAELGDISSGLIEIDFDKPMDKSSITNAIYFYPPLVSAPSVFPGRLSASASRRSSCRYQLFRNAQHSSEGYRGNALDQAQSLCSAQEILR